MHWPYNHVYLSRHVHKGHTDQNAPLSGKYMVDYLHISPNCHYILSSISESHGSPKKTILLEVPKKHLVKNQFKSKHLYTSDDLGPELYGIYLIITLNEREFYKLQVVQIVGHKVKVMID